MAVFFLWQNIRYAFEPFRDHGTIEKYTCSLSGNVVKNSVQMVKQDTKLPCSFFFTENLR